jgi:hypothetical protein
LSIAVKLRISGTTVCRSEEFRCIENKLSTMSIAARRHLNKKGSCVIYTTLAIRAVTLFLLVFVARKIHTTVRVEHTFNASVDKVWAICNDAAPMRKWRGPEATRYPSSETAFE